MQERKMRLLPRLSLRDSELSGFQGPASRVRGSRCTGSSHNERKPLISQQTSGTARRFPSQFLPTDSLIRHSSTYSCEPPVSMCTEVHVCIGCRAHTIEA